MPEAERVAVHVHSVGVATLVYRGLDADGLCRAAGRVAAGETYSLLLAFFDPDFDAAPLGAGLKAAAPGIACQIGCSTAGEIGPFGYLDGGAVLVFFPASRFTVAAGVVSGVCENGLERSAALARDVRARFEASAGAGPEAGWETLALCFLDGLSKREEAVVSGFGAVLGDVPLVGGSAGDGLAFGRTRILFDGALHDDAAALCLLRTSVPFRIFKSDHYAPTDIHLVVTQCDPEARVVGELNGAPAALEYAAVLGLDPEGLDRFSFAAYPVVVKVGGEHFCRSIRRLEPDGLSFFCAVDTGLVLTLAEPRDMAESMTAALLACEVELGAVDFVLGFDCVLRRVEAEQRQSGRRIAGVFERFGVFGFTTYGEQYRAMHLNQTFTGVAFGAPALPPAETAA